MCLVGLAWRAHPRWPLILVGNRDEVHSRPSRAAGWWEDAPEVIGGRDPVSGGAWQAWHRHGRMAAIINLASANPDSGTHRPRGALVREWVTGTETAATFGDRVLRQAPEYRGFCLIFGDRDGWTGLNCGADGTPRQWALPPGITALSNGEPGARWPKLVFLESELTRLLRETRVEPESLWEPLAVRNVDELPGTDAAGLRVSRQPFIVGRHYGTRSSTVMLIEAEGTAVFAERRFDPAGQMTGEYRDSFSSGIVSQD